MPEGNKESIDEATRWAGFSLTEDTEQFIDKYFLDAGDTISASKKL